MEMVSGAIDGPLIQRLKAGGDGSDGLRLPCWMHAALNQRLAHSLCAGIAWNCFIVGGASHLRQSP
jgi:hypothetical protein